MADKNLKIKSLKNFGGCLLLEAICLNPRDTHLLCQGKNTGEMIMVEDLGEK